MSKQPYIFHPNADEQQIDIWLYTYQHWGEIQADKYIDGLHKHLTKVAKDVSLLRSFTKELIDNIKFFHYGRHYVFVKMGSASLAGKIQVLSILHDNMDVPTRLSEILEML